MPHCPCPLHLTGLAPSCTTWPPAPRRCTNVLQPPNLHGPPSALQALVEYTAKATKAGKMAQPLAAPLLALLARAAAIAPPDLLADTKRALFSLAVSLGQ